MYNIRLFLPKNYIRNIYAKKDKEEEGKICITKEKIEKSLKFIKDGRYYMSYLYEKKFKLMNNEVKERFILFLKKYVDFEDYNLNYYYYDEKIYITFKDEEQKCENAVIYFTDKEYHGLDEKEEGYKILEYNEEMKNEFNVFINEFKENKNLLEIEITEQIYFDKNYYTIFTTDNIYVMNKNSFLIIYNNYDISLRKLFDLKSEYKINNNEIIFKGIKKTFKLENYNLYDRLLKGRYDGGYKIKDELFEKIKIIEKNKIIIDEDIFIMIKKFDIYIIKIIHPDIKFIFDLIEENSKITIDDNNMLIFNDVSDYQYPINIINEYSKNLDLII